LLKGRVGDILITLENSVLETVFIVNHVLKVLIVPKVPLINENRIFKCEEYINSLQKNVSYYIQTSLPTNSLKRNCLFC
jgi:hypothetical protein